HPLRGQNNVQGASDMGLIPMFYPDYKKADDPGVRARFEGLWETPDLDPERGLTVTEIIGSALKGGVRGMYMMGENPFLSDPNIEKVRQAVAASRFPAGHAHPPPGARRVPRRPPPRLPPPGEGRPLPHHRPPGAARPQGPGPAGAGAGGLGGGPGHRQPDR